MESYEVEINRKIIPVKAIRNITGHNILRYKIHGDKQVPFVKTQTNQRMEEGDVFAIETFGSTGKAYLRDDVGVYGYGRNENATAAGLHHASAKSLLKTIDENFGTLVFSRRYLERLGVKSYHLGMKSLVSSGIIESYGPLVDVPGSYVAQFEHVSTIAELKTMEYANSIFQIDRSASTQLQRSDIPRRRLLKEHEEEEIKLIGSGTSYIYFLRPWLQQSMGRP
jgi:methionine aminopeptidase